MKEKARERERERESKRVKCVPHHWRGKVEVWISRLLMTRHIYIRSTNVNYIDTEEEKVGKQQCSRKHHHLWFIFLYGVI
jgi:hypothetical protein